VLNCKYPDVILRFPESRVKPELNVAAFATFKVPPNITSDSSTSKDPVIDTSPLRLVSVDVVIINSPVEIFVIPL
jgi:hypothetical protein